MINLLIIIAFFLCSAEIYAFDISGLQPVAPDGVFSTFSTESLPKNKVSVEVAFEQSREPDFFRVMLKGAYGISDNVEFMLTAPYVYNFLDSTDGLEDIAVGFKHRFYDEGKYGPSLAYIVSASLPSGRQELSTDGRAGIGLVLSKRLGPFRGSFNIFYEVPGDGSLQDELLFASGLELATTHESHLLGEFLARRGHYSKEYNQLEARLGYRLKTSDFIHTTIGIGTDLNNRSPEYRLLFSVCFTNAREKKKIRKVYEEE